MSTRVQKTFTFLTVLCSFSLFAADPVDGRYVQAMSTTWTSSNYTWWQKVRPANGGTLYFDKSQGANTNTALNVDTTVSLGRIVMRNDGADYLKNKPVTMVGETPTLTVDLPRAAAYKAEGNATFGLVDTTMKGTGDNVFVQKGTDLATSNFVLYNSYLTLFESLSLCDGTMTACVRDGGIVASGDPITLGEYCLKVEAQLAAATAVTSGVLTVEGASTRLVLDKKSALSLTYTAAGLSLDADAKAATLVILPKAGLSALGSTEIFKLATPPENGWVSPAIVAAENSGDGKPVKFLKYDASAGFVIDTDVPSVSTATAISADVTYAKGLTVDAASTLTFSNGAKLKVGDGTHPAGLAFNFAAAATDASFIGATGDGAIDFGGQDAYIWFTCHQPAVANRNIKIQVPIVNAKDVHLVGRFWGTENTQSAQPLVALASSGNAWTGDLYVSGVRLYLDAGEQFPKSSKVYVTGSPKAGGGQVNPSSVAKLAFSNELVIAGHGMYSSDAAGAFNAGSEDRMFACPVTLADDATVNVQKGNLWLYGTIGGVGALTLTAQHDGSSPSKQIHLLAVNDYEGATYIENVTTYLEESGTFGTGPVVFRDSSRGNSKIVVSSTNLVGTLANDITGGGDFYVNTTVTNLTLSGKTDLCSVAINYYDDIELTAKELAADRILARNDNVIRAADGASVVRVGRDGSSSDVRAALVDGTGCLSFVKKGTNTVSLVGPQRYTGGTIVSNGILKLVAQTDFPLRERCSFHLDASDETTLTTDADGFVSEWRTIEGGWTSYENAGPKMVAAGTCAYTKEPFGLPKYVASAAFGGKKVVRFSTNTLDRLVQSRATKNRTVFMVANIIDTRSYGGFFGKSGADFGLRTSNSTSPTSFAETSGNQNWGYAAYVTHGYLYNNGVKTGDFTKGAPQVITLGRFPFIAPSSNTLDDPDKVTFKLALGGYLNNSYSSGDGALTACRPTGYEIAELIVLKDNVSDAERQQVEDYLAQKWLGQTFAGTTFVPQAGVLNPAGALEIVQGATLDLNGVSQTVASLSGVGTIVNSSATPATLTVTGASDFTGEVKGGVTLVLASGTASLHLSDGASLGSSGTGGADGAIVAPYVGYPNAVPTNGIVYWLDAALSESVIRDENDFVTNWVTRAPGTVSFISANNPEATFVAPGQKIPAPVYRTGEQGWGTLQNAGVYFGASTVDPKVAMLRSAKTCKAKTIFLVHAKDGSSNYNVCPGVWSPSCNGDCGIRWSGQGQSSLDFCGYAFYFFLGDSVRINGVEKIATETGVPGSSSDAQFYLSGRAVGAWHTESAATHALGCYYDSYLKTQNPRGMKGWISEVIAYDRVLSDEETAYVEEYLREKWFTSEGLPEAHTSVFGADAAKTLTVKVSDDKTVSPLTLTGDFDATDWTLVVDDYRQLGKKNPIPAVPVVKVEGGTASGTFTTNVQQPWYVEFSSEIGWSLGYNIRGLMMLVR